MATVEQIARKDLEDKIAFERKLFDELGSLNSSMVKDFVRRLDNGEVLQAAEYQGDFEALLNAHYEDVSGVFAERIREDLPEDVAITMEESAMIASALAIYFLARAGAQAEIITGTNQKNINDAVDFGIDEARRQAAEGIEVSPRERAVLSGASLSRNLRGRAGTIATVETQTAAETSKQTEAEVLVGRRPSILGGRPGVSGVTKEWVTSGDEKVRRSPFNHVAADGQEVDISEPYNVSGELLRWPGDTDYGASVGNIAGCRCGSFINREKVISARFDTRQQILEQAATL